MLVKPVNNAVPIIRSISKTPNSLPMFFILVFRVHDLLSESTFAPVQRQVQLAQACSKRALAFRRACTGHALGRPAELIEPRENLPPHVPDVRGASEDMVFAPVPDKPRAFALAVE